LRRFAQLCSLRAVSVPRFQIPTLPVPVVTIGLLIVSNVFMTFAWYGHLKFKTSPLLLVIAVSWLIALP